MYKQNLMRWVLVDSEAQEKDKFHFQRVSYLGKGSDCMMVFPFGMYANVSNDSLALMFSGSGLNESKAAIAWDVGSRPDLNQGEVCLYHPGDSDNHVILRNSGDIEIQTGQAGSATISASGNIEITGNVSITGNLSVSGTMSNDGNDVGSTHGHSQAADSGGDSQQNIYGVL